MPAPRLSPPRDRWVLHFTHINNLAGIVDCGRLICDTQARLGLMRTEASDQEIKEKRRHRQVPIGLKSCVGDYVPFYFAPRSPMMYRIACDHRDGRSDRYPDGDRPLIYLGTTIGRAIDTKCKWIATDGNAASVTTQFTADLDQLNEMIDWPLMRADQWNNVPDDPDRQRRRMAEFLVHDHLPVSAIRWVGAYSDNYAHRARMSLAGSTLAENVRVVPDYYYGYAPRG